MNVAFSSSKQAMAVMSAIKEIRSDLVVETLKPSETMSTLLQFVFYLFYFTSVNVVVWFGTHKWTKIAHSGDTHTQDLSRL